MRTVNEEEDEMENLLGEKVTVRSLQSMLKAEPDGYEKVAYEGRRQVAQLEWQVKLEMYHNLGMEQTLRTISKKIELLIRNKKGLQLKGRRELGSPADVIWRRNEPHYENL